MSKVIDWIIAAIVVVGLNILGALLDSPVR